ncbi:hypothetical protein V8D89_008557 [Ganoderma adspersum]
MAPAKRRRSGNSRVVILESLQCIPVQTNQQSLRPRFTRDALNIFSGGIIMRSNIHRASRSDTVTSRPSPKEQARFERWSLVFFTRPSFDAPMRALTKQSSAIAEAVANAPVGKFETGVTAGEWLARLILITRANRVKDGDTYKAGFKGTEDLKI